MKRRDFFKTAAIGSAALVPLPVFAHAQTRPAFARSPLKKGAPPANPFVILLQGTYTSVSRCPDLDLLQVNVCDGSYSTMKIFPVIGLSEEDGKHGNREEKAHRRLLRTVRWGIRRLRPSEGCVGDAFQEARWRPHRSCPGRA